MMSRPDPAMDTVGEGLGGRVVALAIDLLLIGTVALIVWFVGAALSSGLGLSPLLSEGSTSVVGLLVRLVAWGVALGLVFGYFVGLQGISGQTLGKRMTDIVVVTSDGSPCTAGDAAMRTLVLLAIAPVVVLLDLLVGVPGVLVGGGLIVAWLGVETIAAALDDRNRRLGDRLAGTVVVRESLSVAGR